MRRIVVAGGTGFFGRAIVDQLRDDGFSPLVASRSSRADLTLDVEDDRSLRRVLRAGDVIVDAAGPFQRRTTCLVAAASDIGCDLVDIADSLRYVRGLYDLRPQIDAAGIRVYTACSSVSAISAAMIRLSGIAEPVRIRGCLVPATKHTAVAGTAASLFQSVGRAVDIFDNGVMETRIGWREAAAFALPGPVGHVTGYLFETADAMTLPAVWPSLQSTHFFVDANVCGLNAVLCAAAKSRAIRIIVDRCRPLGLRLARWLGREASGLGYEIEDSQGNIVRMALVSNHHGYVIPVAPAVIAAARIASDEVQDKGLILADQLVEPNRLLSYLRRLGIELTIY